MKRLAVIVLIVLSGCVTVRPRVVLLDAHPDAGRVVQWLDEQLRATGHL